VKSVLNAESVALNVQRLSADLADTVKIAQVKMAGVIIVTVVDTVQLYVYVKMAVSTVQQYALSVKKNAQNVILISVKIA